MEIIDITPEMELKARAMEAQVLLNLKSKPNYTGLVEPDRYYIGFLGELCFEKFLQNSKIPYTYSVQLDGQSQGSDFTIELHRLLQVEIKTARSEHAYRILVPQAQFDHRTFDLYVGIRIIEDKAQILGYCFKDQFEFTPNGFNQNIPTYYRDYNLLYDPANLMNTRNLIATDV